MKAWKFFLGVAILFALAVKCHGQTHVHVRVDHSQSKMGEAAIESALNRAAALWEPHGILLDFSCGVGCTKSATAKDLHVHLSAEPRSGALGFSNAAACNTVRDSMINSGLVGSVVAHELAHCWGLENKT